jgi:hypothetical protein
LADSIPRFNSLIHNQITVIFHILKDLELLRLTNE